MQCRHQHKGTDTGDDAATLCKDLVNFGAATPQITFLICVPSYCYWEEKWPTISIRRACWHFQMRWTIELSLGAFKVVIVPVHLV